MALILFLNKLPIYFILQGKIVLLSSSITTFLGVFILTAVYFYLYAKEKEVYLKTFAYAFTASLLKYICDAAVYSLYNNLFFDLMREYFAFLNGLLILLGTYQLIKKDLPKRFNILAVAFVVWITFSHFTPNKSSFWYTTPVYFFTAAVYIWAGIKFLSFPKKNIGKHIAGITLIVWGIHKADYPFLISVDWLAQFGYALTMIMSLFVALGTIIFYFQKIRDDLAESKNSFQLIAQNAQDIVFRLRIYPEKKFEYVSPAVTKITGYTPEEYYREPEIYNKLIDDAGTIQEYYSLMPGERTVVQKWKRKDGAIIWVEQKINAAFEEDRLIAIEGIARDITELKSAEENLKGIEKRFREITMQIPGLVFQFLLTKNGGMKILYISDRFSEMSGMDSILAYNDVNNIINAIHPEDKQKFCDKIRESARRLKEYRIEFRFITASGEVRWAKEAANPHRLPNGDTIWNGVVLDITDRKNAEEAVRISKQDYETLVDTIDGIVWEADARTFEFTFVSKQAEKILGYPVQSWIDNPVFWKNHIHPDDRVWVVKFCVDATCKKTPHQFEYRMIAADGRIVWLRDIVSIILENNEPVLLRGIMVDITERKNAELEIISSKIFLENVLNTTPSAVFTVDLNRTITSWNATAERITGYKYEDVVGKKCDLFASSMCKDECRLFDDKVEKPGVYAECDFRTKYGNKITTLKNFDLLCNQEGKITGGIESFINITERKRSEQVLHQSEERYRKLVEMSPDPIVIHHEGIILFANPAAKKVLAAYDINQIIGKPVLTFVHPDYREVVKERVKNMMEGESANLIEEKFIRLDGAVIDVEVAASPFMYDDKLSVQVFFKDITERKRVEEELKLSEKKYRNLVENTTVGVYKTNIKGDIIYVNSAFAKMLQFDSPDDMIKHGIWRRYISPEDRELLLDKLNESGYVENFDVEYSTKYGNTKNILLSAVLEGDVLSGIAIDNTERKNAQQALQESEARYRSMFESTSAAMLLINPNDGMIWDANKSACEFYGYSKKELINKKITEIDLTIESPILDKYILFLKKQKQSQFFFKHKLASGEVRDVEVHSGVILVGGKEFLYSIIHDITERRKAEEELLKYKLYLEDLVEERTIEVQHSEERFRSLAEHTDDMIIRFNDRMQFLYMNPVVEKNIGMSKDDLIGTAITEITNEKISFGRTIEALEKVYESKKLFRAEFEVLYNAWFDWHFLPEFDSSGNVSTVVVYGRDITERKKLEETIKESLQKEKELNELKTRFISTASHEFRTPLTAVLSSAELLERYGRRWNEDKYNEHINRIRNSVDYLTQLMNDVLTVNKAEAGKIEFSPSNIDLAVLCSSVIDEINPLLSSSKHNLSFDYNSERKIVRLDKKLIRFILLNLLSNAVKYSPSGGNIRFTVSFENKSMIINISDEGIGIGEDDLTKLFEPFHRGNNIQNIRGTGLGLSIVKKSVELHGGKIDVQSKLNEGSIFTVHIPFSEG
ncbi:MAG: PAS domain S-box protein [Ignavibacteriales bacterium]|nr:PAS domain S-box protein [Ignavibacteriales bacterium]